MQLRTLEYLLELERIGSINKAARSLFISQQGLSHAIDALENELGVTVFERSRQGVRPTREGRLVIESARKIVEEIRSMESGLDALKQRDTADSGRNRPELVVSPYVSFTLLNDVFSKLGILRDFRLSENSREEIGLSLAKTVGRTSSGVGIGNAADGEKAFDGMYVFDWLSSDWMSQRRTYPDCSGTSGKDSVRIVPIIKSRFGLVCEKTSDFARNPSMLPSEVMQLPLVTFNGPDYMQSVKDAFSPYVFENIVLTVSDQNTIISFLAHNRNVYVVSDELSYAIYSGNNEKYGIERTSLAFVPIDRLPKLVVGCAYLENGEASVARAELVKQMANSVSHLGVKMDDEDED